MILIIGLRLGKIKVARILLTGEPRVGKSTVIEKIIRKHSIDSYVLAKEIRKKNERIGFKLITPKEDCQFAYRKVLPLTPRVGRYWIDVDLINKVCIPAVEKAMAKKNLFVFDEFGAMQMLSRQLKNKVYKLLESNMPLLTTITKADFRWARKIKSYKNIEVIEVTRKNRKSLPRIISIKLDL